MQREVKAATYEAAANFVFLEHLLRITTPDSEVKAIWPSLPAEVRLTMQTLLQEKNSNPQKAIRRFETTITSSQLNFAFTPLAQVTLLTVSKGTVRESINTPDVSDLVPALHLLTIGSQYFIPYLPEMSYVDGYDPYREEDHFPIIPDSFILSIKSMLYVKVHRQSQKPSNKNKKGDKAFVVEPISIPLSRQLSNEDPRFETEDLPSPIPVFNEKFSNIEMVGSFTLDELLANSPRYTSIKTSSERQIQVAQIEGAVIKPIKVKTEEFSPVPSPAWAHPKEKNHTKSKPSITITQKPAQETRHSEVSISKAESRPKKTRKRGSRLDTEESHGGQFDRDEISGIVIPPQWKEVERQLLSKRKARDECGSECRVF